MEELGGVSMSKIKRYIVSLSLVVIMAVIMLPQQASAHKTDFEMNISSMIDNAEEVDLIDPTNDNEYMLLTNVEVSTELMDDNVVKITLTNRGSLDVTDWSVAYEAEYKVLSIENAEVVSDSEVVEFASSISNKTIKAGESTTVILAIDGTYHDGTVYRVYGLCDGVPEYYSVADFTTYDLVTGKTTLETFNIEDAQADTAGLAYTKSEDANSEAVITDDEVSPNTIIGSDDRSKVTSVNSNPYNRIACLIITWSDGTKSQGTGFMISSQYMLTAAHCVYNTELGKAAKSITAYFGANGSTYSKSVSSSAVSWCSAYPSDTSSKNDWGCIKLNSEPGRGYFSIGYTSTSTLESSSLTLCGYPGDKAVASSSAAVNGKQRYMYKMSGKPSSVDTYTINYKIDTYGGQSGSPVYNSSNVVYAIHNKGNSSYNKGRRLTSALVNSFVNNGWCSY